jgi:energy-coupling factor transporter ATP-binding protein EcfA2
MYLRQLRAWNVGALREISLELPFGEDGAPKPVVLVGPNGSGKTTLISVVADALVEGAAQHFRDVAKTGNQLHRPWLRVVGGKTISIGSAGSLCVLNFKHEGEEFVYFEKGGNFDRELVRSIFSDEIFSQLGFGAADTAKHITLDGQKAKSIFRSGAYVFFPSSRDEIPIWMNRNFFDPIEIDIGPSIEGELKKPILVERGLDALNAWMVGLKMDSRADLLPTIDKERPNVVWVPRVDPSRFLPSQNLWNIVRGLICEIFGHSGMQVVWMGRNANHKFGIFRENDLNVPGIEGLSAGQSSLLSIFGTLLRYGNAYSNTAVMPGDIHGICLIDEIDSHLHVDLQVRAVPNLLRMFPKIQFIFSCHSYLTMIGMEKVFGGEGFAILDLPHGTHIPSQMYSEVSEAVDALRHTQIFLKEVAAAIGKRTKATIMVEGKTDREYLLKAAHIFDRKRILDECEFEWIGSHNLDDGGARNSGKDGLNKLRTFIWSNPRLFDKPVVMLYDQDARKTAEDYLGRFFVREVPGRRGADLAGMEGFLPQEMIERRFYKSETKRRADGGKTTIEVLDKTALCKHICENAATKEVFAGFVPCLDMIDDLLMSIS